jgi:membrane associated rhomboid family serine protease
MARFPLHMGQGTRPIATLGLIALCVLVFIYELSLDERIDLPTFIVEWGLIPERLFGDFAGYGGTEPANPWLTLITSLFLHADWAHIIVNMIVLLSFGSIVEDWVGAPRFLIIYLIAGVASGLLQSVASIYMGDIAGSGRVPVVGASGAVAGLLGYAMVTQPHMRIVFFIIPMPIWLAIVLLVVVHALAITLGWGQGIAWWGHLGGLVAGMVLAFFVRPRFQPDWQE